MACPIGKDLAHSFPSGLPGLEPALLRHPKGQHICEAPLLAPSGHSQVSVKAHSHQLHWASFLSTEKTNRQEQEGVLGGKAVCLWALPLHEPGR